MSTASHSNTAVLESEVLYLIAKFLKSSDKFEETFYKFSEELEQGSQLGSIYNWDGSSKVATLTDFDSKFPSTSNSLLLDHLRNSTLNTHSSNNTKNLNSKPTLTSPTSSSSSLLKGFQEIDSNADIKKLVGELVEKLSRRREVNYKLTKLQSSIEQIRSQQSVETEDSAAQQKIAASDGNLLLLLHTTGRAKEMSHWLSSYCALEAEAIKLESEISLTAKRVLTSKMYRGNSLVSKSNDSISLLIKMDIGIGPSSTFFSTNVALGSFHSGLNSDTKQRLYYDYSISWNSFGHMFYPVYCVVFDQTGRFVLTGADDYLVKCWDVEEGRLVYTCRGHVGEISIIVVSPDNSLFASACTDGDVRLWRLRDGVCITVCRHRGTVNWMKFDMDRGALVSVGDDGQCIVWDLAKIIPLDFGSLPLIDCLLQLQKASSELAIHSTFNYSELTYCHSTTLPSSSSTAASIRSVVINVDDDSDQILETYGTAKFQTPVSSIDVAVSAGSIQVGNAYQLTDSALTITDAQTRTSDVTVCRGSLFEWSSVSASDEYTKLAQSNQSSAGSATALHDLLDSSKLILPHMNDNNQQLSSDGDDIKINCFDICPLGNIVVTGCEDGVARVWRFSHNDEILSSQSSVGFRKSSRKAVDVEAELQHLKGIVSPKELLKLKSVTKHLLLRLEGHIKGITDVHFSHAGDRLLTSGCTDGTVRVWAFNADFLKCDHIILNVNEDCDHEICSGPLQGRRGKKSQFVPQVHNACWVSNDFRIVTLQTATLKSSTQPPTDIRDVPTSLKVWDSLTGDLLAVLSSVSAFVTKVLQAHPFEPNLVLTGSYGGQLCLWDINNECSVFKYNLSNLVDQRRPDVLDASFSPDGTRISVSDAIGRISILSLDRQDRYRDVKKEQYFSTDYAEIFLDSRRFAIDAATRLPVHRAPRGPLCRQDGTPYDDIKDSQPTLFGPNPLALDDVRCSISNLRERKRQHAKAMERTFATFLRNKARGRQQRNVRWNDQPTSSLLQASLCNNAPTEGRVKLTSTTAQPVSSNIVWMTGPDINQFVPSSDESDNDSDWGIHDRDSPIAAWSGRGGVPRADRSIRHSSSQGEPSRGSRQSRRVLRSRSRGLLRSKSRETRQTIRNRRQILSDNGSCSSNSEVDSYIVMGSDAELVDSDCGDLDEERNEECTELRQLRSSQLRTRKDKKEKRFRVKSSAEVKIDNSTEIVERTITIGRWAGQLGSRVVPQGTYIDRRWLQFSKQLDFLYCPQVGDRVYYIPQGHMETLQQFPEGTSPPWNTLAQRYCMIDCLVRNISYDFPSQAESRRCNSALAIVTLAVMRTPQPKRSTPAMPFYLDFVEPRTTRHSHTDEIVFNVTLRYCHVAEFLVLKTIVDRALRAPWYAGLVVTAKFIENEAEHDIIAKEYRGTVLAISNFANDWPNSPWNAVEVHWEDSSSTSSSSSENSNMQLCPWEIVQTDGSVYHLDEVLEARIVADIGSLMETGLYSDFEFEVDKDAVPDYHSIVAVPMYVDLICRRLREGYYRQMESLEFDINQIEINCLKYNVDDAPIVQTAGELVKLLHLIVRPDSQNVASKVLMKEDFTIGWGASLDNEWDLDDEDGAASAEEIKATVSASSLVGLSSNQSFRRPEAPSASSNHTHSASSFDDCDEKESMSESKIGLNDSVEGCTSLRRMRLVMSRAKRAGIKIGPVHELSEGTGAHDSSTSIAIRKSSRGKRARESDDDSSDEHEQEIEEHEEDDRADDSYDDSDNPCSPITPSSRRTSSRGHPQLQPSAQPTLRPSRRVPPARAPEHERSLSLRLRTRARQPSYCDNEVDDDDNSYNVENEKNRLPRNPLANADADAVSSSRPRRNVKLTTRSAVETSQMPLKKKRSVVGFVAPTPSVEEPRRLPRLDRDVKVRMYALLHVVEEVDVDGIFARPVDITAVPDYLTVIDTPMDLSTIRSRIGSRGYDSVDALRSDLLLMLGNCEKYNHPKSTIYATAKRIRKLVEGV